MEFLGIGAPELIFILILALILLGPKDMQKAGKTIGAWLNNVVKSDWWRAVRRTSEEIRSLPTNLMREANREMMDLERDLRQGIEPPSIAGPRASAPTSPVDPAPPPGNPPESAAPPPISPTDARLPPEPKPGNPPGRED